MSLPAVVSAGGGREEPAPGRAGAGSPSTVGSLFSGIGGLDLGLERAGFTVRWQCEVDPFCSQVLAKHWPGVPNLGDVTAVDWSAVEPVDLIAGGFPCQPNSYAGRRRGTADERWLWPRMRDAIAALRPRYVVVENVAGLLTVNDGAGMGEVLGDLAALGFDAEWSFVSACRLGAPHSRDRLFVLAYSAGVDVSSEVPRPPLDGTTGEGRPELGGSGGGTGGSGWWVSEPAVDRMADGVPSSVVRPSLEALGNAVVPQVAEYIGRRIMAVAA